MEQESKERTILKPLCKCDPLAEFKYERMGKTNKYLIVYRRSPYHQWRKMLNEKRRLLYVCFDEENVMPNGFKVDQVAPGVYVAFAEFIDFDKTNPPGEAG